MLSPRLSAGASQVFARAEERRFSLLAPANTGNARRTAGSIRGSTPARYDVRRRAVGEAISLPLSAPTRYDVRRRAVGEAISLPLSAPTAKDRRRAPVTLSRRCHPEHKRRIFPLVQAEQKDSSAATRQEPPFGRLLACMAPAGAHALRYAQNDRFKPGGGLRRSRFFP